MSELRITVDTAKTSMAQIRPALDEVLAREFPAGILERCWNGDVLELSGPGAQGTIVYQGGQLVGEAVLKPPASMLRPVIEEKMTAAMHAAASS